MNPLQRVSRSAQVSGTAARIYLEYRRQSWQNRRLPPEEAERRMSALHRRSAERILATASRLQGMLIKVGQIMGARADIFPDEYVEVLSKLHDTVPPRPYHVIREVVEHDLGARIDRVFAEFERVPIASASLAQVHRARLHDGRDVAVKVQYPDIAEIVRVDLQNLRFLVSAANRIMRDFDFTPIIEELNANVPLELDFINEGHNAEATARNFAGHDEIVIPEIYWEYTTRRVLTMEFVEGIKVTDVAALDAAGIERQAVARLLTESYVKQIFAHGFFHADPHPGNLFIQPGPNGPRLVIVDFGLAKQLPPGFLQGFVRLTTALVTSDTAALAQSFRDLGFRTRHADDGVFEALGEAMVARLSRNDEFNQNRQMLLDFQQRMMRLFRENPVVRVPGEFLLIGRVMGLLSGLGAQLGSQVNLLDVLGAHVEAAPSPPDPVASP
jgi:predicted unusual protein kinase regulating ubiquinone biosynthesis (AarF/ABC1/UbiB family)